MNCHLFIPANLSAHHRILSSATSIYLQSFLSSRIFFTYISGSNSPSPELHNGTYTSMAVATYTQSNLKHLCQAHLGGYIIAIHPEVILNHSMCYLLQVELTLHPLSRPRDQALQLTAPAPEQQAVRDLFHQPLQAEHAQLFEDVLRRKDKTRRQMHDRQALDRPALEAARAQC